MTETYEALEKWSQALGVRLGEHAVPVHQRGVAGQWIHVSPGVSNVYISPFEQVQVMGLVSSAAEEALSWTLKALVRFESEGKQNDIETWVIHLQSLPYEKLLQAYKDPGRQLSWPENTHESLLFLITFPDSKQPANTAWKETFEEVIQAFFSDVALRYVEVGQSTTHVLLFCPDLSVFDVLERDEEMDEVELARDGQVRYVASSLKQVLEEDAMLSTEIAVYDTPKHKKTLAQSLVGLEFARRLSEGIEEKNHVAVFGESPTRLLGSVLNLDQASLFLEAAASRVSVNPTLVLAEELQETLQGLIAANLNVSEAARKLYLHRNTLLHRIERIRTETGYDIRQFEDANTLWISLLVQSAVQHA